MKAKLLTFLIALGALAIEPAKASEYPNMPIALVVTCESPELRYSIVSYFTKALRKLGDVNVVGLDDPHVVSLQVVIYRMNSGYAMAASATAQLPMLVAIEDEAIDHQVKERLCKSAMMNETFLTTHLSTFPPGSTSIEYAVKNAVVDLDGACLEQQRYLFEQFVDTIVVPQKLNP
jgi:hypothetical protein